MAKKSSGKHYTSKGIVGVNRKVSKAVRRDRPSTDIMLSKFEAYLKGKNVMITIDNPNPNETAKRKIRVSMRSIYGDPREYLYGKDYKKRSS